MKRNLLLSFVLITVLIGGGTVVAGWLYAIRAEAPRREAGTLPPLVDTLVIQHEDVTERYLGFGTARPDRLARIAAEVPAVVAERVDDLRSGTAVRAGQALIRLDDREFQQARRHAQSFIEADNAAMDEIRAEQRRLAMLVRTAEQEFRVAENEQRRVADLFERELAAEKEFNVARLAYQQARRLLEGLQGEADRIPARIARLEASRGGYEAAAAMADLNVERCLISAPFDGVVDSLFVEVGDRVSPGVVVLTLVDAARVEIPIRLAASTYDRVQVGAACAVSTERRPSDVWKGRVARVAPTIDEQSRTFAAYILVDNREQTAPLVPGTFVRAAVEGPTHRQGLLVPRGVIRNGTLMVVEDERVRQRSVTIERLIQERALVSGELRAGERIILTQLDDLAEGVAVRIHDFTGDLDDPDRHAITPGNAP